MDSWNIRIVAEKSKIGFDEANQRKSMVMEE